MSTLVSEAIVLHTFDYLETSRIIRLMTRDAGVQSVIARGARNSRKRFGSAIDLFAQGTAEMEMKEHRELQVLSSFELTRGRPQFARDVGRFTAGSMIAELALRTSSDAGVAAEADRRAGASAVRSGRARARQPCRSLSSANCCSRTWRCVADHRSPGIHSRSRSLRELPY